jgi:hypothetical protein
MEYPSSKGSLNYSFIYLVNDYQVVRRLHLSWYEKYLANTISTFDVLKLERALEVERMSNLELQKKIATLRSQPNTSAEPSEHRGA